MSLVHSTLRHRIVRVLGSGTLSDEELLTQRRRIVETCMLDDLDGLLVDLRSVVNSEISTATIERLARLDHSRCGLLRIAIVAPQDVLFGLSRMYHQNLQSAGGPPVEVFRDIAPALSWLRREGEQVIRVSAG